MTLDIRAANRLYASGRYSCRALGAHFGVSGARIHIVLTPGARKAGREARTALLSARNLERTNRRLWLRSPVLAWLRDAGYRTCLRCLAAAELVRPFDGRPRARTPAGTPATPDWVLPCTAFAPPVFSYTPYCRACYNAGFRARWQTLDEKQRKAHSAKGNARQRALTQARARDRVRPSLVPGIIPAAKLAPG